MQKIPDSHPREIFVYDDKGFKSFTPEVKDILGRDYQHKPQKTAVPKYVDYTRGMLKDEIEKGKKAQAVLKEGVKDHQGGDDQLKEDYEQLVEEFGAMETEHEQLREKYRQLRKDHAELQKEHERVLHELSGRREMQGKAPGQKTASAPLMRPRDEGSKQPPVLDYKSFPPIINKQARETQEAQEAREGASAQAREKEPREQEEAKIREWEEANFVKELEKRERELREERVAREQQRLRTSPNDSSGAGRPVVKREGAVPQVPVNSIRGGLVDSQSPPQTVNQRELSQDQKTAYPIMQQSFPYQPKPAFLRQANDLKSVSFNLPMKTLSTDQEPAADQKSDPLQQTHFPKSVSAGLPTEIPSMGQLFPAQQLPVKQPPVQQPPVQQFPFQQRSARLQQADDPRSFPYGPPMGIPTVGQAFPPQQKSAPLRQTDESKNVSFCLPAKTASTPINSSLPTLSSQIGPQVAGSPRSQEPSRIANFDQDRVVGRMDQRPFIRRSDAP